MAKLRKMLGRADDPQIISLMRMIETQSKRTLAAWAADCAADRYLPIYELACPGDARLRELIGSVRDCLRGDLPMADLRARLREARTVAKDAESSGTGGSGGSGSDGSGGTGGGTRRHNSLRRAVHAVECAGVHVLRSSRGGVFDCRGGRFQRGVRSAWRRRTAEAGGFPESRDDPG